MFSGGSGTAVQRCPEDSCLHRQIVEQVIVELRPPGTNSDLSVTTFTTKRLVRTGGVNILSLSPPSTPSYDHDFGGSLLSTDGEWSSRK